MRAQSIIISCLIAGLLFFVVASGYASKPVVFFSDLTDGPISGWEGSSTKGAAVSIWGLNFGSSRGSGYVTCGGVNLTSDNDYAEWGVINEPGPSEDPADVYSSARGLQRITFWLNSDMTTGPGTISVTTSEGTSNTIPFYCRALGDNYIYFISRDGSDSNNGLYSTQGSGNNGPWFSATKVRTLQAGDVAYFRSGVWDEEDSWGGVMSFLNTNHNNGIENKSITIASYPGEIAQLGSPSMKRAIRHLGSDVLEYWTFSKFILRGTVNAVAWGSPDGSGRDDHVRFIGNDVSTYSTGAIGLMFNGLDGGQTNLYLYGNHIHDTAVNNRGDVVTLSSRAYGLYFQGYGTHNYIYVGWNEFAYDEKGRVQFYGHTPNDWIDHLYFHDNYVHHMGLHGVILGGGDGGSDYQFMKHCYFYNNIIAFNGQRYPNTGGKGILMGGEGWGGNGGDWYIYNNTFYGNKGGEIYVSSGSDPDSIVIKNNIIVAASGRSYYSGKTGGFFSGNNNCYFGGTGNVPSWDLNSMETNPKLLDPDDLDFHLPLTSPCIDAGSWDVSPIVTQDYEGIPRPQGSTYDIGAYEYAGPDSTPPVISDVACSNITDSSATITWVTNERSTSQVEYGMTTDYGSSTPLNNDLVTNHSVMISGLISSTTYYFRVKSQDASGNLAVSQDYSFTTGPGQPGRPHWR